MDNSTITCPKCQTVFPLTEAITQPIVSQLRKEFDATALKKENEFRLRDQELALRWVDLDKSKASVQLQVQQTLAAERKKINETQAQKAREDVGIELNDLRMQLEDKSKKLGDLQQAELTLLGQKRELEEEKAAFQILKLKQIDAERDQIRIDAARSAIEGVTTELQDLKDQLQAKQTRLLESQAAELKLRNERAAFEEQKQSLDLEIARHGDAVKDAVKKEKDEEFRLKEAEKNKQLDDLKLQIDELKRKAEQGSQQSQGEVLELDLAKTLQKCFPGDEIVAVPKGTNGADLIHLVKDAAGNLYGSIIWETKRTKAWTDSWLGKLKDDKLAAKAQLGIIVSTTMPKGVEHFECREDIWITRPNLAIPMAAALRLSLIEAGSVKRAVDGRHDKMAMVYDYLSGLEFKSRITSIVEAFTAMRDDLEAEKKGIQRIWAKREKQLERVLRNTSGLHGDLSGIIGKSLPSIEQLELSAVSDTPEESEMLIAN